MNPVPHLALVLAAATLAGCATAVPPVAVTRFHAADTAPIAPGSTYAYAAPDAGTSETAGDSIEQTSYRVALDRELARIGLVAARPGDTAQLRVRYSFTRQTRDAVQRSPVTVGVGGGTGGYGSGVGIGLGFNLGGGNRRMVDLTLAVRIDDAATGTAQWEGRAETAVPASAPAAQPALAAAKLTAALFRDFPGESGRTITVP